MLFQTDRINRAAVIGQLYLEIIVGESDEFGGAWRKTILPAVMTASPGEVAGPLEGASFLTKGLPLWASGRGAWRRRRGKTGTEVEARHCSDEEHHADDCVLFIHEERRLNRGNFGADAPRLVGRNRVFAARMPRAAFHQSAKRQKQSDDQTVFCQCIPRIMRARRSKAAAAGRIERGESRRYGLLVKPDKSTRSASRKGVNPRGGQIRHWTEA